MFGFDPVAVVTGRKADGGWHGCPGAGRWRFVLAGKGVATCAGMGCFRRLRAAILYLNIVRCLRDSVRIRGCASIMRKAFLLQAVQLERCEPVLPDVGKKSADIVGVYVIHDGCNLILGYVII